ncbi:hypothetical protein BD324DRAFT_682634 [Kockovaella imperatae]|uniref:Small nuclear ribonucleoprotein Prp3 C-terminal domain-containing protein n=1 Tax=Kockovaella imperatae TaxID=4999 RepID=A0A1Y1UB94_9TREE|nr:hypothetical protein BD324DRAFT_682634 [Kockovaella imperatae]ORX35282.1 hypothetical protein BD324DRAFT_682634 [Kockovaella imperatae]
MRHDVQEQVDLFECLRAMYPLTSELEVSEQTALWLSDRESGAASASSRACDSLDALINLEIESDLTLLIHVGISIPLNHSAVTVLPRQPEWMTRSSFDSFLLAMPKSRPDNSDMSEHLLGSVDWIRSHALEYRTEQKSKTFAEAEDKQTNNAFRRLERVWFWFPSLSSKEKRRDLVDYAAEYDLKGFVLAGKPGLLCLEGDGSKVDKYMSAVKSESWSDIPSYQKKVTERLRKPLVDSQRRFADMKDIAHLVPQYGQYNHRGEMSEVKRLMDQWGVGEDFGSVVMSSGASTS